MSLRNLNAVLRREHGLSHRDRPTFSITWLTVSFENFAICWEFTPRPIAEYQPQNANSLQFAELRFFALTASAISTVELQQNSDSMWISILGYVASASVLATFCMSTMISLRLIALGSNVLFSAFGALAHIYPIMILHLILLPVNTLRLI